MPFEYSYYTDTGTADKWPNLDYQQQQQTTRPVTDPEMEAFQLRYLAYWNENPPPIQNNLKQGKEPDMETLYQVIVVSKDAQILLEKKVVAEDHNQAKIEVDIHAILKQKNLKLKDVTIICHELGDVKVRKEVQKVKVVDKDEE